MKLYEYIMRMKDQASDKLRRLGQSAAAADNKLNRLGPTNKKVENSFYSLSNAVRGLVRFLGPASLGLAIGLAIKSTVALGANFDYQMSRVGALTNSTIQQFDALEAKARKMGETTAFTASQSADAMSFMAMAGLNVNQILQAIQPNLNLAAAAQVDLARAADISTNVMTQFGLQASDTNRIVDVLTKGTVSFNTNLEELATAMNYMGPTAHAFNMTLEETTAMYGLLANSGLKGSLATRALGTSLTRLAKPTSQMEKLMKQMNIQFFDQNGRFIGMTQTVRMLEQKLKGASDEMRQGVLATLFGAEAIQEWNILLGAGSKSLQTWTRRLEKAGGTAEKIAKKQLDNLKGDFITLKSAVEGTALAFYDRLEPSLRQTTQALTVMFRGITESMKPVNQLYLEQKSKINALTNEVGPLIFNYRRLSEKTNLNAKEQENLRDITKRLSELLPGAVTQWDKYGNAIGISTTKIDALVRKSKEALQILNQEAIKEKEREIFNLNRDAINLQARLNTIAKTGKLSSDFSATGVGTRNVTDEEIQSIRDRLKGITGKGGLLSAAEEDLASLKGIVSPLEKERRRTEAMKGLLGFLGGNLQGSDNTAGGKGFEDEFKSGLDSISGGGSKSVNVTINLQSLVGEQKFNVNNVKESVSDMERQVTEALLRVLNSANYAAAQ
jgi:TP901 family phage tail tape measure protein